MNHNIQHLLGAGVIQSGNQRLFELTKEIADEMRNFEQSIQDAQSAYVKGYIDSKEN